VGRDESLIRRTVGCKPIIRDTEDAARRAWEEMMALNRTPMEDVIDDDTFWVGTPEQIAETMVACRDIGFTTFLAEIPAPFDPETLERWIGEVKPMVDAG
jgi:alkanesulfonate monooxygenase SsuD/methylene tetrahydromethanopterin reductase-like flavin-dependent oxidoreductase (luciferase family)